VDIWDDAGRSIVEHVAGVNDFEVAEATYWAAVAGNRITLPCGRESLCDDGNYRRVRHSHLQGARKHQPDHRYGADQHADWDEPAFAIAHWPNEGSPLVEGHDISKRPPAPSPAGRRYGVISGRWPPT
jgi:hypothetical protein